MNGGIISKRYAKALLSFARSKEASKEVYSSMNKLADSFFQLPALRDALGNPLISKKEKQSLIENAMGSNVNDVLKRFIDLVLFQKREKHLQCIALMYMDLYRKENNIYLGHLTTATAINDSDKKKMQSMMTKLVTNGSLEFKTSINPKLLGGFILNIDSRELDASIATQLQRVKDQFMEQNRKSI